MANSDSFAFRNHANSGDLVLTPNSSDQLTFNGALLITTTGALTNNTVPIVNNSGVFASSSVSSTTLGFLDATSSIQTQINTANTNITTNTTNLSAHTGASSGVHGVTGSVVGTTGSQTLTNKTIVASSNTLTGIDSGTNLWNTALVASIASNILTVSLSDSSGSSPSSTSKSFIGFRNPTSSSTLYNVRTVSASLSLTIGTAVSLGLPTSASNTIYIFALDNAGTVELFASAHPYWDEGTLQSTSTTGTSNAVLFGANARSTMPVRLIGRIKASWTSGTGWISILETAIIPFSLPSIIGRAFLNTTNSFASSSVTQNMLPSGNFTVDSDTLNCFSNSSGALYTVAVPGKYAIDAYGIFQESAEGYNLVGQITINGTAKVTSSVNGTGWGGGTYYPGFSVHHVVNLASGDIVRVFATQQNASAASRSLQGEVGGTSSYLSIQRVGL